MLLLLSTPTATQTKKSKSCCSDCFSTCSSEQETVTKKNNKKETKKKKKKARKKKKKAKQQSPKKTFSKLEYEELKVEKTKLLEKGNKEIAIKYIEKMVPLCTDLNELSGLMLELADLLFDLGYLARAELLYTEFVHLYPGDQKAEYASYKAVLCSYWKTLDYFRDQSKTKETVDLAKKFLNRKDVFTTYTKEVEDILIACNEKLFESEVNIFNFYVKRGDYLAAQTRLTNIEKEFLPLLPGKEPDIITLACDLAEKQNNKELLTEKQKILEEKFPEYLQRKTIVASSTKKRSSVDKF